MRSVAFLKKEIMQMVYTVKIFILPGVFFFTGAISPLLAKLMPTILKMVAKSPNQAPGMIIKIPPPKPYDACIQLFKNLTSTAMIIVILIFVGIIVEERLKGTATLVLTKTISRVQFVVLKFLSSIMLYTFSFILMIVTFLAYSYYLFPNFRVNHLWETFFAFWTLGILIIGITIFASTIGKSFTSAVIFAFIGFTALSLTDYIPYIKGYSPNTINTLAVDIIKGLKPIDGLITPCIVSFALFLLFLIASVIIFRRQEDL